MGNTKKRRESVMTFSGEEDFIVPKKGGYGQPDNENFLMIEGKESAATIVGDTPSISNRLAPIEALPTDGTPPIINTPPVVDIPPVVIIPPTKIEDTPSIVVPYKDYQNFNCEQLKSYILELETYASQSPTDMARYMSELKAVKEKASVACAVKEPLPTFPDFSTLSCTQLDVFIKDTESLLSTSKFSNIAIAEAYNEAVRKAKSLYATKCSITTIQGGSGGVIITPIGGGIGIPPFLGGGGGGVGGGGGEDEQPTATETKPTSKNNYWWILLVIGGVILLTRKKSN